MPGLKTSSNRIAIDRIVPLGVPSQYSVMLALSALRPDALDVRLPRLAQTPDWFWVAPGCTSFVE